MRRPLLAVSAISCGGLGPQASPLSRFIEYLKEASPPFARNWIEKLKASPLGRRLMHGTFWSLFGSLISRGAGLLSAIAVGRILGKADYGALGMIQNTVSMFGMLAGFGMGLTANKHVAEYKVSDPSKAGRIIGTASILATCTSGLMACILYFASPWLASRILAAPQMEMQLNVSAILLFLGGVNGAQNGALAGFESFKAIAQINLRSGLLSFPLMLVAAQQWNVLGVVWALVAVQAVVCILSSIAIRREAAKFSVPISYRSMRSDRNLFWTFSMPAVMVGLLNSFVAWGAAAVMVNQAQGYEGMGIFTAASRVKMLPEALLAMLVAPMLPILSQAIGSKDIDTFKHTSRFNFLLGISIIVPPALIQVASPSLTLIPFGREYTDGESVVVWLMMHSILYALMSPANNILISMGKMWFSWSVNLIFAVVFALGAWLTVPSYGATGYAGSMFVAYLIGSIPCMIFLFRNLGEVMHALRWTAVSLAAWSLFVFCVFAQVTLSTAWATVAGVASALGFLAFCYRLHGPHSHK